MIEIKAYKCSHCNKKLFTKASMTKHESMCFSDPETKSCITCFYFYKSNDEYPRSCHFLIDIENKLRTQCNRYLNIHDGIELSTGKKELTESGGF